MGSNGEKGPRSLLKKVEDQWQRSKEHAQTYPYVWASYGVVWGGLSIYTIYTWRRLRRMEDRVRAIQHKIKQITEAEEAAKFQEAALKKQMKSAVNSKGSGSEQTGK